MKKYFKIKPDSASFKDYFAFDMGEDESYNKTSIVNGFIEEMKKQLKADKKISIFPSKPFENATEYQAFMNNFCRNCRRHKIGKDGFSAIPEEGGCPVEVAI